MPGHNLPDEVCSFLELAQTAVKARHLPELAQEVLAGLAKIIGSPATVLYLEDPRLLTPRFFQRGLAPEAAAPLARLYAEQCRQLPGPRDLKPLPAALITSAAGRLTLLPLRTSERLLGLLGLVLPPEHTPLAVLLEEKVLPLLAHQLHRLLDLWEYEKRLAHLNTYLTVSSMIAQSLDLRELLETILSCCMEAVDAEAASILLLYDDKANFRFYSVVGPARELLMTVAFPAARGLSGYVLESQQSEVINEVYRDRRFYGRFDTETGFQTRNMIIIPLTAGEERIGLLEVLNKSGGELFTEDERLLLNSIAEEIAFAVRNAKIFEYVVNTYCKQRQGQTCEGCQRPLGSWTPCVKYREGSVSV